MFFYSLNVQIEELRALRSFTDAEINEMRDVNTCPLCLRAIYQA